MKLLSHYRFTTKSIRCKLFTFWTLQRFLKPISEYTGQVSPHVRFCSEIRCVNLAQLSTKLGQITKKERMGWRLKKLFQGGFHSGRVRVQILGVSGRRQIPSGGVIYRHPPSPTVISWSNRRQIPSNST